MKKNDFAAFIVYVLMFALAVLIGLLVIRGVVSDATNWGMKPWAWQEKSPLCSFIPVPKPAISVI